MKKTFIFLILLFFGLGLFSSSTFSLKDASVLNTLFNKSSASQIRPLVSELISCEQERLSEEQFVYSSRNSCYSEKLTQMTKKFGSARVAQAFREYIKRKEGRYVIDRGCHILGHDVGLTAVRNGEEPRKVLQQCVNFCDAEGFTSLDLLNKSGCFNGVAHGYVVTRGTARGWEEDCESLDVSREFKDYGCYHGAGHGLAEYTNYDIVKGLEFCDEFTKEGAKYQCGHALLMEPYRLRIAPLDSIPPDIPKFCQNLREEFKSSCEEFAGFLTYVRTLDPSLSISVCERVSESYQEECAERLGEAFYLKISDKQQAVVDACQSAGGVIVRACLRGVVTYAADIGSPKGEYGVDFCGKTQASYKEDCYYDLSGFIFKRYGRVVREEFCSQIPKEHQGSCQESEVYTKPEFK